MSTQASSTDFDDQFASPPPESVRITDDTTPLTQTVLPCPFCGAQMHVNESGHLGHPSAKCVIVAILNVCHGSQAVDAATFIELWNTRASK
jgi:hypothetical protein